MLLPVFNALAAAAVPVGKAVYFTNVGRDIVGHMRGESEFGDVVMGREGQEP